MGHGGLREIVDKDKTRQKSSVSYHVSIVTGTVIKSLPHVCFYVVLRKHRRMGTLWLGGGAEGLIWPKFYTDNRRGYRIS